MRFFLIYFAITVCALVAVFATLGITPELIWNKLMKFGGKRSLASVVYDLGGRRPKSFVRNYLHIKNNKRNDNILKDAVGQNAALAITRIASIVGLIFGVLFSISIGNPFLILPLGTLCFLAPNFIITFLTQRYKKKLNRELEGSLRIITSSYKHTGNLTVSVRENIRMINNPVRQYWNMYLFEMDNVDASVTSALNRIRNRVPNRIFYEWVNSMIQCQSDKSLEPILDSVLERFADEHEANARLVTEVNPAQTGVVVMAVASIVLTVIVGRMTPEWGQILLTHWAGKLSIAIMLSIDLLCLWLAYRLGFEVEYSDNMQ